MSFESAFRKTLKSKSTAQLESMILDLSERVLDAQVSRQAAPRLVAKWRITVNERRHRRIQQRDLLEPKRNSRMIMPWDRRAFLSENGGISEGRSRCSLIGGAVK